MPNFGYKAGLQHVGSYQVSGRPFVTGSVDALSPAVAPVVVRFPKVTRWVELDFQRMVCPGLPPHRRFPTTFLPFPRKP